MSDLLDQQFANLVQAAAPPKSDPLFRLKVLEKREAERFRRRTWLSMAALAVIALSAAAGLTLRPASFDVLGVLFFGVAGSAAWVFYAPLLGKRLGFFRR